MRMDANAIVTLDHLPCGGEVGSPVAYAACAGGGGEVAVR